MLKDWARFAGLFAFAMFALVGSLLWALNYPPQDAQWTCKTETEAHQPNHNRVRILTCKKRQPEKLEQAAAGTERQSNSNTGEDIKVTDKLLVVLTGLLVGVGAFQAFYLYGTLRATATAANAARDAANAADLGAKAVVVVERAYVYPVVTISPQAIDRCIQAAIDSEEEDSPAPVTTALTFKFKNFGKTPAVLKSAFVAFGVAPHGALLGVAPESVLASMEESAPLNIAMQIGITRRQAQRILTYTGHISFEGNITYDDIWGNEHTTEFYFVWDKDIGRMALKGVETKTKPKGDKPE